LLDPDHLAAAVDVSDLERDHLRSSQAGPVGNRQSRFGLEARRGIEQTRDLPGAQDHGQPARLAHGGHPGLRIRTAQGDTEEEAQGRDRGVHGRRRSTLRSHVHLVAPQVLGAGLIRRAAEKGREVRHRPEVSSLGGRREAADRHVLDETSAQRADRFVRHGSAPV
jgi:hypothetical protein